MAAELTRLTHKIAIQLHHFQFSLQVASPVTFGCVLVFVKRRASLAMSKWPLRVQHASKEGSVELQFFVRWRCQRCGHLSQTISTMWWQCFTAAKRVHMSGSRCSDGTEQLPQTKSDRGGRLAGRPYRRLNATLNKSARSFWTAERWRHGLKN
jgi:hypothetical protein